MRINQLELSVIEHLLELLKEPRKQEIMSNLKSSDCIESREYNEVGGFTDLKPENFIKLENIDTSIIFGVALKLNGKEDDHFQAMIFTDDCIIDCIEMVVYGCEWPSVINSFELVPDSVMIDHRKEKFHNRVKVESRNWFDPNVCEYTIVLSNYRVDVFQRGNFNQESPIMPCGTCFISIESFDSIQPHDCSILGMNVENQKVISITGVVKTGTFYRPGYYLIGKEYGLIQVEDIFCYIDAAVLKDFSDGDVVLVDRPQTYIDFASVG